MSPEYPEPRPSGYVLNEADTCRVHIVPALQQAGWGNPPWRIKEQHYFTDGQIVLVGNGHRRLKGKKADYLLRCSESLPVAIVEAKAEVLDPAAGLQQAKDYAQALGFHFAYSSNGHAIVEWDFTTNTQTPLAAYPTPDQLWQRLVPVPPLHRQQEFAALRRQIAAARDLQKSLPEELDALQSALLDKAFRGEL